MLKSSLAVVVTSFLFVGSAGLAQMPSNPSSQAEINPQKVQLLPAPSDAVKPAPSATPAKLPMSAAAAKALPSATPGSTSPGTSTGTKFSVPPSSISVNLEQQLIRRVVVFPMMAPEEIRGQAEEAWWQVREELTKSRRFLVASKQFLLKNDTYQPRGLLEPADAIILGRLLDSHAIITSQLKDRVLTMAVYDGTNGFILWQKSLNMHPSIALQDQLIPSMRKMIDEFIASVPYQAFQTTDPLIGRAVYQENNLTLAQVDVGLASQVQVGDTVQWIRISPLPTAPVFQGGAQVTVYAEGKVLRFNQGIAVVEVIRATRRDLIKEYSLVRLPREYERLQNEFVDKSEVGAHADLSLLSPEAAPMEQIKKERRPLVTTGSILASIVTFLILAL